MNKRISDLLDHYADESVDLSGGSPLSSARIKELTMNKITEQRKPRLRRLPIRIAAAAAVAAALTVSALAAAHIFGAGDLMQGLFRQWTDEPLTTTQVETLNGMGRVFDGSEEYSVTSNGATMTPIAALADEDCYYLQLRIEAPEGTVLPDLDRDTEGDYTLYGFGPYAGMDLGLAYGSYHGTDLPLRSGVDVFGPGFVQYSGNRIYGCCTLPDDDPTDNVKDIVLTLYSQNFKDIKFNDGEAKKLHIKGLWVERRDEDDPAGWVTTPVFRGDFILDIGGSFESQVAVIDCGGAEWTSPDTGEVSRVDTMKLSPLGLKFEFSSNLAQKKEGRFWIEPAVPRDVRVVMKDGSELCREYGHHIFVDDEHKDRSDPYFQVTPDLLTETPEWELGTYWAFDTPLDLSQVDYVQLGEDYIYYITTE